MESESKDTTSDKKTSFRENILNSIYSKTDNSEYEYIENIYKTLIQNDPYITKEKYEPELKQLVKIIDLILIPCKNSESESDSNNNINPFGKMCAEEIAIIYMKKESPKHMIIKNLLYSTMAKQLGHMITIIPKEIKHVQVEPNFDMRFMPSNPKLGIITLDLNEGCIYVSLHKPRYDNMNMIGCFYNVNNKEYKIKTYYPNRENKEIIVYSDRTKPVYVYSLFFGPEKRYLLDIYTKLANLCPSKHESFSLSVCMKHNTYVNDDFNGDYIFDIDINFETKEIVYFKIKYELKKKWPLIK